MGKQWGGRGSKYSDEFKRRLVAESHVDGVSMPMVSRRHSVPTSRIYAWRGDVRFQPGESDDAGFMPNNRKVKNTLFAAVWLSRFKGAKYVEAHLPGEKDILWYVRVLHFK